MKTNSSLILLFVALVAAIPAPPATAQSPEIKDWAKLCADEQKLFARHMEVFAAFGEYSDFEIGRLFPSG